jgi:hypothetical protein
MTAQGDRIEQKLDRLQLMLGATLIGEAFLMAELQDLQAAVARSHDVVESALILIKGIAQKLADAIAAGNPAALIALKDDLVAEADKLADAVAANTDTTV